MAQREFQWPPIPVQLLLAIAKRAAEGEQIEYVPACWFRLPPTPRNRSRWSRWSRRLARAGLIRRLTELNRDRVRRVAVTPAGLEWIEANCGPGALLDLNLEWNGNVSLAGRKTNG